MPTSALADNEVMVWDDVITQEAVSAVSSCLIKRMTEIVSVTRGPHRLLANGMKDSCVRAGCCCMSCL